MTGGMEKEKKLAETAEALGLTGIIGGSIVLLLSLYSVALARTMGHHRLFPTWVAVFLIIIGAVMVYLGYQVRMIMTTLKKVIVKCVELNMAKVLEQLDDQKASQKNTAQGLPPAGSSASMSMTQSVSQPMAEPYDPAAMM